jgi:hypothetical protein
MTEPQTDALQDNTTTQDGLTLQSDGDPGGVKGGNPDRLDAAPHSGGMPAAGADGQTAAREQLRKDLGERPADADTEAGDELEQAAATGEIDDPQGGSIQAHGSRPA